MNCQRCGAAMDDSNRFCPACGSQNLASPPGAQTVYVPVPMPYELPRFIGMFIASMVLGIVSIWMYPIGLIAGVLAVIFYAEGLKRLRLEPKRRGKGMGIAGLVTGIIGMAVSSVFWIFILVAASNHG